ncbi:peptidoglycan editing factor PgeF [Variovorax sp. dw_954]|uniref:peptidoglycan editing factor PgeF n=1 Tax=Variovorax sp. dw_954 TaxID=2720078 RepID=UPI001BD6C373|nr:peptidoglycan editing factor PgeF [Variovorax sp. dw_954]
MPKLDLLAPQWPAPAGVRAACTTRVGGVSQGRFESLNLGDHVGDDAVAVAENRRRLQGAIGVRPVFLQQVHGVAVRRLDAADADGETADGCVTAEPGLACTVMVADCLPVLFTDTEGRRVAAAHAGWRGLAAGVLEATLATFGKGEKVMAWLGPCIGPTAFEVGPEVMAVFEARDPASTACFRPAGGEGKWLADLSGLARRRLLAAGALSIHGNDGTDAWCTVSQPLQFFSHRRDGSSGRFAACIWRS